ncbi:LysR family transcriptional regulator [Actinophytocola oryzae]|uniref:DNA-binding transcriptional LysR family regulator n=1 Tax=Actinophytocola oryzae TaxID=502181 RepID=A0A4V3FU78_9PSEU|nr:LysR family transcriptional regulator [Actinophytocola oryzae]TDV54191.1 DNA-binding transcriptional LysR family regulator [Actinophytocola oryzae]
MELRLLAYFVAVAEERHFGRAATRLHISQPPLSRAIRQLEHDLDAVLLHRSPSGVALTPAGKVLYDDARTLLAQAEQARVRVAAAAGTDTITVGSLAGSAEQFGDQLVVAYRRQHPGIRVRVREADFTDPTSGLRKGLVDVALTLAPFDGTGVVTHVLRSDPVGVVLRDDDPLATRDSLTLDDLAGRRWFRFPDGTDPVWRAFWRADSDGPEVRTVHECQQAVLWNGTVGLAPLTHRQPAGLTAVALRDMPSCELVVAWPADNPSPLVRSFVRTVTELT